VDNNSKYRKIFRDVVRGYSLLKADNRTFFVKHLTVHDQVDLDDIYAGYYESAKKRGLPTEKEASSFILNEELWSKKNENTLVQQRLYIDNLITTKKSLVLKSQLDRQNEEIEKEEARLNVLEGEKKGLMGLTCEAVADKKVNDHYIINSLYDDKELTIESFSFSNFLEIEDEQINNLVKAYNKIFENFEELIIQQMILRDFYYVYFPFCEDSVGFFGSPICNLTHNQLKMIIYTRIFKNIFEQHQNIPESIKSDPEALLDYGNIDEKARAKLEETASKDGVASTFFGATKEDLEYAGVEAGIGGEISLSQKAEEKGGKLTMQDLMEMQGHGR